MFKVSIQIKLLIFQCARALNERQNLKVARSRILKELRCYYLSLFYYIDSLILDFGLTT